MMGRMASRKIPGFVLHPMIRLYIWHYNIDMNDYDIEIKNIKTFNEFFTRKLKSGARKFEGKLLSPSDSKITDFGKVNNNIKLAIKGMECSINELLMKRTNLYYQVLPFFIFLRLIIIDFMLLLIWKLRRLRMFQVNFIPLNPRNWRIIQIYIASIDVLFCLVHPNMASLL